MARISHATFSPSSGVIEHNICNESWTSKLLQSSRTWCWRFYPYKCFKDINISLVDKVAFVWHRILPRCECEVVRERMKHESLKHFLYNGRITFISCLSRWDLSWLTIFLQIISLLCFFSETFHQTCQAVLTTMGIMVKGDLSHLSKIAVGQ